MTRSSHHTRCDLTPAWHLLHGSSVTIWMLALLHSPRSWQTLMLDHALSRTLLFSAVYITANVSGGHLNPAVTFATCLTGHTSWAKGGLYVIAQIFGGIFGSLLGVSSYSITSMPLSSCQCVPTAACAVSVPATNCVYINFKDL